MSAPLVLGAAASGPLVGREAERARLAGVLDAALLHRGTTVLLAGEAGIGKSRLAADLAVRARDAGFDVLVGHALDFVGTEVPYQAFLDALRPLERLSEDVAAGSRHTMFHDVLAAVGDQATIAPVLVVLEDLHWADASTGDLVVFLANNLVDHRAVLLGTYRADEPASADRMRRLANGVRRCGSAELIELGPLAAGEMRALLEATHSATHPVATIDQIVARSDGNPLFAEELRAAGERDGQLPDDLRDLMLQRTAGFDDATMGVLRTAAVAGRDVESALLRSVCDLSDHELLAALRRAVDHGVLTANQQAGTYRFRHALLAEAVYATILPGEREVLHGRVASELVRRAVVPAGELARHWAVAGRPSEALVASILAARQAEAAFGPAEAHGHLERVLALWDSVPDAAATVGLDLAEACKWAADMAGQSGAAPRAVALAARAIELVGGADSRRSAALHASLGGHLHAAGHPDAALTALETAATLVPADPPSPERAHALTALAAGLMLAWRYGESLAVGEHALVLARALGTRPAELRCLNVLGIDLAYLGRSDEGLAHLWLAAQLARADSDPIALERAYINLSDVLLMLGRPIEAVRAADEGFETLTRVGTDHTTLNANLAEALLACGEWDRADEVTRAAIRAMTESYQHQPHILRGMLDAACGRFVEAHAHFDATDETVHEDAQLAKYKTFLADLALWERRWPDAADTVEDALTVAPTRHTAQIRVQLCAQGLWAQAELAALARAHRDRHTEQQHIEHANALARSAQRAAQEATPITPNASGWHLIALAELERACGVPSANLWSGAAQAWDDLHRPPLAAYCQWRQAEALIASGADRTAAAVPLRQAHATAIRLGAAPLAAELERLAARARLDLTAPHDLPTAGQDTLGLTARESEILALVARGYTNREIANALTISTKTASVHVSHILRKLAVPNRREAAAVAHRLSPP